jgi:TRAP transporter TAXI family solute receptor
MVTLNHWGAYMRTVIMLGTATPGGGFPVYGQAFAETVNEFEQGLEIRTRNTKGSTENIALLEAGEIDLGLVQGEAALEALNGLGRPPADLRIIAAMYASPGMFVVRADAPYKSIADLVGKRIAFGAKGSGLVILARYVLDGLGIDRDRDFEAVFLDRAGDGPQMVMSGEAAALWGAGVGWPGFNSVTCGPAGGRFIVPDAGEITRIQAKHPFLKTLTVPAGTYPGQTAPIVSVGSWSFVLARPDLADETAYKIARALHRGEAAIATRLEQARETTAANTVSAAPKPDLIHPGVQRYLREIGLPT